MAHDWADVDLRALAREGAVHFMGVSGAGMSALAELTLRAGGRVTGCDSSPGAVGDALRAQGAGIEQGHDPAHVADAVAVVTTAAVPPDHPELAAARARGIPVLKRSQALGALVNRGTVLAIAGTHGKTTTAMATAILAEASLDPTAFVGGVVPGWGSGLRAGSDSLFVVEADEYDRSFMTLRPDACVVTSIEADHLDIYGSLDAIESAFAEFVSLLPPDGLLAACTDDAGARRLLDRRSGPAVGYGTSDSATLRAVGLDAHGRATTFDVEEHGRSLGRLTVGAAGVHNVRNALGALAVARHAGADFDSARRALAGFHGVDRRFQELGTVGGVTVVDDYAHHPTEVATTLAAARAAYPGRRLVAAFQPHLFTRTRDFARAFGASLAGADLIFVADVYAAREQPLPGVTGELVASAATAAGAREVAYAAERAQLLDALASALREGDVLVTMGAGDIDGVARAMLATLGEMGASR
jgi:UDP-N-acetylmuramate--alanine ligase